MRQDEVSKSHRRKTHSVQLYCNRQRLHLFESRKVYFESSYVLYLEFFTESVMVLCQRNLTSAVVGAARFHVC